jgi:hypothetical protein
MSAEVSVHVRLGAVRLDFEGDRTFYERHVEGLVDAAARAGGPRANGPAGGNGRASAPARTAPVAPEVDGAETAKPAAEERPRSAAFVPQSGEFGRFIRRLGPEAGEPDRQVTAFAFYLWYYEKKEAFGREHVVGCFRALGLAPPQDHDRLLDDLTERRRFLETTGSDAWRLSRKGENYVKTRLLAS